MKISTDTRHILVYVFLELWIIMSSH